MNKWICIGMGVIAGSAQAAVTGHWNLDDGTDGQAVTAANPVVDVNTGGFLGSVVVEGTGANWVNDATRGIVYNNSDDNSRLRMANNVGADRSTGFTWSIFAKVDSTNTADAGADVVFGTRASNSGRWFKADLTSVSSWHGINYSGGTLADDTWHHLAIVGDSISVRVYKDGVLQGFDTSASGGALDTLFEGRFEVGGSSQFSEDASGFYSDASIWDESLTLNEIQMLSEFGSDTDYLYNATEVESLMALADAAIPGDSVVVDGQTWYFRDDVDVSGANIGQLFENNGANFFGLGNGIALADDRFRVVTPEPGTAMLALFGMGILRALVRREDEFA